MHPILTDSAQADLRRKYPPFGNFQPSLLPPLPDGIVADAKRMRSSGMTWKQVGRELKIDDERIRKACSK